MYFNLISFKGSEKACAIRTESPLDLVSLIDKEVVALTDASTSEVVQFRPADVLRINTINEELVKAVKPEKEDRPKKKAKGLSIS